MEYKWGKVSQVQLIFGTGPLLYYALKCIKWILNTRHKKCLRDLISNSPYCLPYISYDVSLENLVLDRLIIPLVNWYFFDFLITWMRGIVSIFEGEVMSESLISQ